MCAIMLTERKQDKQKGGFKMNNNKQVSLSKLRKKKGLSQRALAKELHFSAGTIGLYETGRRKPSLDNAKIIAKYFNVPVETISFANIEYD